MVARWNVIQDSNDFQALNPQEQTAAQQRYFDNVIFKDLGFQGLGQIEQSATKTRFFSQGPIGQQQRQTFTDTQLVEQLQGSLPLSQLPPTDLQISPEARIRDPQRQQAYDTLLKRGKTPEQIKFILGVNKKVEAPPTLGRTTGAIAGSLALPFILGQIPPFTALPEEAITFPIALAKAAKTISPLLGGGFGGGIGETAQIALEEKRQISKGEFLKAFGKEVAFEAIGRGAVRSVKFALAPFIKRPIRGAAALADDFAKVGGVLPPTALDRRFTLSLAEEVGRGAFGSRQVFEEMGQKSGRAARVYASQMLDLMADSTARLGPEQLGKEFAEGITRPTGFVFRELDDVIDVIYTRLDDLTESQVKRVFKTVQVPTGILDETGKPLTRPVRRVVGKKLVGKLTPGFEELEEFVPTGVSTRKLKRFWLEELKKNKEVLKLGKKGAFTLTPAAIKEGESVIRDLADNIPHRRMRDIRSRVLRDIKKLHRDVGQDEALLKRFEGITFDALTDPASVKGATPEVQNLFNNARQLYTSLRQSLETTFPENMAKRLIRNPSSVTKELFPRNNPTAIRRLRQDLIEPISGIKSKEGEVLWMQLRTAWFDDAIEQATKGGVVKPAVFENIVRRQGKAAINEMLPDVIGKRQLQTIEDLLTAMSKKPAAGASLFIRGGQVSGVYLMYDGAKDGDFLQVGIGGTLIAGPYFFAKIAAHPLGSKLLRSGINLKPGSTSLVPITARLINLANKIDRDNLKASIKRKPRRPTPRVRRTGIVGLPT